ncbi:MAG: hypothetical protein P4M11_06420 [Candidatus Pacebacteria bacterium]|nr:hypothetical protein [Candidatus Paceibacterota bacterium]
MDENTIPEPSLEESIQYLLNQVPVPVRDFVLNQLGPKTEELMMRYQLHVDQGGILERELLLMLLGQEEPAEFVAALQGLGLDAKTVQDLTNDINSEIFVKLRSTEEKSPENVRPAVQQAVPAPQPAYVPPAPQPVAVVVPAAPTPTPAPSPTLPQAPTEEPEMRTMASDMEMVKSGTYQVPRPEVAVPPMPKSLAPQSENREALHNILKEYGIDPYREPVE